VDDPQAPDAAERGFLQYLPDLIFAPGDAFSTIHRKPAFWIPLAVMVALALVFTAVAGVEHDGVESLLGPRARCLDGDHQQRRGRPQAPAQAKRGRQGENGHHGHQETRGRGRPTLLPSPLRGARVPPVSIHPEVVPRKLRPNYSAAWPPQELSNRSRYERVSAFCRCVCLAVPWAPHISSNY